MKKLNNKIIAAAGVFVSRFASLPANFSPMGSFGFFSNNLILYAIIAVGVDILKGGFYRGFYFTYLGFLGYFVLGRFARSTKQKLILLPVASLLFFLVSNFGVWMYWYPKTVEGLLRCYSVAVPFYRNTLLGDVVFGYSIIAVQAGLLRKIFAGKNIALEM